MRELDHQHRDQYIQSLTGLKSNRTEESRDEAEKLGLLDISISYTEAQILNFFVKIFSCEKFVEIGTLTGFSGQAILSGLRGGGTLWTFEKNPTHAKISSRILGECANTLGKQVHVVLGDAEVRLSELENKGPFDGIFIDGNKASYGVYLDWAEKNLRPGGLIVADNVFLGGNVWGHNDPRFNSTKTEFVKGFNERFFTSSKFESMFVPTQEGLIVARTKGR